MKYRHFSIEEREKIQELRWNKVSIRNIAKTLGRSHSSVVRELNRYNREAKYTYKPRLAEERALEKRKSRGRKDRLKSNVIRQYVVSHLKIRWSPEQISGRLKKDLNLCISHEAIYQYIYAQIRIGAPDVRSGKEDLRVYLRRRRKRREPKGVRKGQRVFKCKGNSIDSRPLEVNERKRVGDWESDTVVSKDHKPGVNTLVERKTGYVFITKLRDRTSEATSEAITSRLNDVPTTFKQTITFDNGFENQRWQETEHDNNVKCFFAHPYHSWERGTNENTNGLIRDYFPKKTDFTEISLKLIQKVEYDLNTRPRKRLNWSTPLEAMSGAITG